MSDSGPTTAPLQIGQPLGAYKILALLGKGGMGEVYRARDTRLNREVAIKVLPGEFAQDADRLRRFEQEAHATSALNHPNILTVYDVGTHEGAPYLVAELLEGEELRTQLDQGALPVRKAIEYAQQIAAGLAAAHEKDIVHRDLKPENLFVTKDGRVKILDFGLAKLKPQAMSGGVDSEAPTMKPLTSPGVVMGTVGYMSPEQVRGHETDHRSDIFSFGIILHEMLSGQRTFTGDSLVELMNAILKDEPAELSETNAKISPALDKIVRRCLEKKPEQRFHSAHDLGFALSTLSSLKEGPSGSRLETATALPALTESLPAGKVRWFGQARLAWLVAAALLLAALPFVVAYFRRPQAETTPARFSLTLPEKMSGMTSLALSPDGRRLAFAATHEGKRLIWVRPINALTAQPLAGTDDVLNLFWSPDSRFIGFFTGGKLKKIEATGGPAQTLCDARSGRGGTWNRDGVIVFAPSDSSALYRVAAAGGAPVQLTALDPAREEDTHRWPQFLPDGRHFLYLALNRARGEKAVFVGSLDAKDRKLILTKQASAAYCPPGYLLFVRERALMAQAFDAGHLQLTGEAVPIAEQVGYDLSGNAEGSYFSVSENGVLAYQAGATENRNLVWFDRSGKELGAVNPVGNVSNVTLSPGGKRGAITFVDNKSGTENRDIWLIDLERNTPTRFTFHPALDFNPVWSPDGSRVVFSSNREGSWNIYQKFSSGVGSEELLLKLDAIVMPTDWSSDGQYILLNKIDPKTNQDLWVLPLFGDRQPFPFLATEFRENVGRFSPDGHWITYASNESGKFEVYVQSFPTAGGKKQISTGGGMQPLWRRDGRELFYLNPERKLMAVEVKPGASFEYGVPRLLFETRLDNSFSYAVSLDGQRFLLNVPVGEQTSAPINIVTNWTAEMKK